MERAEQRLKQFEVRKKGILFSVSQKVEKTDRLLEEMIAEAQRLGCFPVEHFVPVGQLGKRKADVTQRWALHLRPIHGRGHALLIPADDGTFVIVTTDRKAINKIEKVDYWKSGVHTKSHLEYHQYSTWSRPVESPFLGLELRLEAAEKLGEIIQTAIDLKSQREQEQGV